jgi:hypothetical protein
VRAAFCTREGAGERALAEKARGFQAMLDGEPFGKIVAVP